jgi:hypothetical protein
MPRRRTITRSNVGRLLAPCAGLALGLAACAGAGAAASDRYPEQKRPEPARSASDGEVLGASKQSPADTLEGSLTNEHPAPRSPHAEEPANVAAHERLTEEECIEANKVEPLAPGAEPRKRPVCPPPEAAPR